MITQNSDGAFTQSFFWQLQFMVNERAQFVKNNIPKWDNPTVSVKKLFVIYFFS